MPIIVITIVKIIMTPILLMTKKIDVFDILVKVFKMVYDFAL